MGETALKKSTSSTPIMIYKPEKDWEFRRILIKCDGPHHTYSHLRQAVSMIMAEYSASAGKYK